LWPPSCCPQAAILRARPGTDDRVSPLSGELRAQNAGIGPGEKETVHEPISTGCDAAARHAPGRRRGARVESGYPGAATRLPADVVRHCRGMHEDQAILECLQANVHSLRSACRQVIEGGR